MSEARDNPTTLALDQLCDEVKVWSNMEPLIQELIRRAKEMDNRLADEEKEAGGVEPMPEQVDVWLYQGYACAGWHASTCQPEGAWPTRNGPYQIFPGIMSLEQLWDKHKILVWPEKTGTAQWWRCTGSDSFYTSPARAQWGATQIALQEIKEGGGQ